MIDIEELDYILRTLSPVQFAVYIAHIEYPSDLLYNRTLPTYKQLAHVLLLPIYPIAAAQYWIEQKGLSYERIKELREEKEREKTATEKAFEEGRGNLGPLEHVVLRELNKYDSSDALKVRERIAQSLYVRPHVVEKIFCRLRRRGLLERRKNGRRPITEEIMIEEIADTIIPELLEVKAKIAPIDYPLYDLLKNHPEMTYVQIARTLRIASTEVTRKVVQYRKDGFLEKRTTGRKAAVVRKTELIKINLASPDPINEPVLQRPNKHAERDARILEAVLGGETYSAIWKRENLSHQGVQFIVRKAGFSLEDIKDLRKAQIDEKRRVHTEHQALVNTLQQYYFNRMIEEGDLPHALAWRYEKYHGRGGNYTIEQLEKVIELRLQCHGYRRCIKRAGIATEDAEIRTRTPQFALILKKSLEGVSYQKPDIKFGDKKYLTTPEEEAEFIEKYGKVPDKDIRAKRHRPSFYLCADHLYYSR